jgi:fructose-specific phosphotransferase system IIA component
MKLSELLNEDKILFNVKFTNKEDAIKQMVDSLAGDPFIKDINAAKKSVLEREEIMSTGVGNGFAIPHTKTSAANGFVVVFAKLAEPIDFDAHDGQPVNLIFLLIGKETMVSEHIKMLSRISRLMNNDDFRMKLIEASSKEEIINLLSEEENKYFS